MVHTNSTNSTILLWQYGKATVDSNANISSFLYTNLRLQSKITVIPTATLGICNVNSITLLTTTKIEFFFHLLRTHQSSIKLLDLLNQIRRKSKFHLKSSLPYIVPFFLNLHRSIKQTVCEEQF